MWRLWVGGLRFIASHVLNFSVLVRLYDILFRDPMMKKNVHMMARPRNTNVKRLSCYGINVLAPAGAVQWLGTR